MNQDLFKINKWLKKLEKNTQLQKDLDDTFTLIGIHDEHISSEEPKRSRFTKDLLWGNIVTKPALFSVIDSPFFQRQRLVTKLGFTSLSYPGATHTLLEHSLGCLNLIQTIMQKPVNTSHGIPKYENNDSSVPVDLENLFYEHAALFHDIGQPVYGIFSTSLLLNPQNACFHTTYFGSSLLKDLIETAKEDVELVKPNWLSEESFNLKLISSIFVLSTKFRRFYDNLWCFTQGQNKLPFAPSVMLAGCILGASINGNKNLFWDLYHGPFGAKTIDELLRDTKNCGITSPIDHQRMLSTANLLYLSKNDTNAENYDSEDIPLLRAYVIDQFDPYVFRELKMSIELIRSRVYANSWRKAFKDLYQVMLLSAEKDEKTTFLTDTGNINYLKLWSIFEETLLDECKINSNKQTSLVASRLIFRQAPKRCLSLMPDALEIKGFEFIKDENKYNHKLFLKINAILFERIFDFFEKKDQAEEFAKKAKEEIFNAIKFTEIKLKTTSYQDIELYVCVDNSYYDHDVTSIGFKKDDKHKYTREELFEVDTKSIQNNRVFFYTTNEIGEIAYLVLKKILYEQFYLDTLSLNIALRDTQWAKTSEDRQFLVRPHISDNHACTVWTCNKKVDKELSCDNLFV